MLYLIPLRVIPSLLKLVWSRKKTLEFLKCPRLGGLVVLGALVVKVVTVV